MIWPGHTLNNTFIHSQDEIKGWTGLKHKRKKTQKLEVFLQGRTR